MKRTSMILTIAAVVSLTQAVRLQTQSTTQLAFPVQDNQVLVETAAAVLFGGNDVQFAQAADQALNQITFNLGALKKSLKDKAKNAIMKQAGKVLAQTDKQVATYILSEIANGNPRFMQAFAEVSVNGVVAAQSDAQSTEQMFDWVKSLFSKKPAAQASHQAAQALDELIEAEVANYIRAQGQGVFDDCERILSQSAPVDDEDEDEDEDDDDDDIDAQVQQAVQTYILSQSLGQSNDEFQNWFAQSSAQERTEFLGLKDKLKKMVLQKIGQYKGVGQDKLKSALGDQYDLVNSLAKPYTQNAAFQKILKDADEANKQDQAPADTQPAAAAQVVSANLGRVRYH